MSSRFQTGTQASGALISAQRLCLTPDPHLPRSPMGAQEAPGVTVSTSELRPLMFQAACPSFSIFTEDISQPFLYRSGPLTAGPTLPTPQEHLPLVCKAVGASRFLSVITRIRNPGTSTLSMPGLQGHLMKSTVHSAHGSRLCLPHARPPGVPYTTRTFAPAPSVAAMGGS